MKCKICKLSISDSFKFAIKNNFCPQCGNKLFSDKEVEQLSVIQSKVSDQGFAASFSSEEIYNVSQFIFGLMTSTFGIHLIGEYKQAIDQAREEAGLNKEPEEVVEDLEPKVNLDEYKRKKIRNEIANEIYANEYDMNDIEDEEFDKYPVTRGSVGNLTIVSEETAAKADRLARQHRERRLGEMGYREPLIKRHGDV